ncbi:MAG: ArsR family transcriptional regulator [Calditrichaeota bacterium]|nr:MAG: ArsR family transcriptional regulator [Calditrichota bacterium]
MDYTNDALLELISNRFKILSDANRLKVLSCLRNGEKNVTQIIEETGLKQANVSKILIAMAQINIVARRKDGNSVFYHIVDDSIFELCSLMCSKLQENMVGFSKLAKIKNPFEHSNKEKKQ